MSVLMSDAPAGVADRSAPTAPDDGDFYARIPSRVLGSRELTANEKIAYGGIDRCCQGRGLTNATNRQCAEACGLPLSTFETCLRRLRLKGFVECVGNTFRRVIKLLVGYRKPRLGPPTDQCQLPLPLRDVPLASEGNIPHGQREHPSPARDTGETERERDTDDPVVVVVTSASLEGGGEEKPPPHPVIAEALDQAEAKDRPKLAAEVDGWLAAGHPAESVADAIRETSARKKVKVVWSVTSFATKLLANWKVEGEVTLRHAKPRPAPAPATNGASGGAEAEQAKADRLAREHQARADQQAREAALAARWEALPEFERETIRARVKAANPALGRWGNLLAPLYLAELERTEVSS